MRVLLRSTALAITLAAFAAISSSTSLAQESKKEPTGSVSGRVTLGDKPVPRAVVMLTTPERGPQRTPPARATTDEDGRYRLTGVPAGSYTIAPSTPAFVVPAETSYAQPGKSITLSEGEEVDGIDFSLIRGGVITGRVTDADGRPLVEQYVNIIRVDERGQKLPSSYFNPFRFGTDDRGVYRLYGLAPGRYKVSVGDSPDSGMVRIGFGGGVYTRTFHPDVLEESKAAVIEASAGSEATNIDIKLARASNTYVATGRVLDADSGKPLSNLQYGHGSLNQEQTSIGSYGWTNNRTNDKGEFRIEGLGRGRYAAFVVAMEQVDFYSEPAVFAVNDSDLTGLEIKVRRGSSISGLAVLEGSEDEDVLAKMSQLELIALRQTEDLSAPSMASARIGPDGSFRITGLRPGKARISFGYNPSSPKGFSLLRVEREGLDLRDGIEIGPGETVSGVRVVLGYGTGVVRGQVKVEGGEVTPDLRFRVLARRVASEGPATASTTVDARGRFSLQNLMPGDYEIVVNAMFVTPSPPGAPPPGRVPPRALAKQNVSVTNGVEMEVTLVVNLGAKNKDGEK
jgi:hypothetical protein